MTAVRYVSSVPALCWDPVVGKLVKVVRKVDEEGREWEEYDDGPTVPIAPPEEPKK